MYSMFIKHMCLRTNFLQKILHYRIERILIAMRQIKIKSSVVHYNTSTVKL